MSEVNYDEIQTEVQSILQEVQELDSNEWVKKKDLFNRYVQKNRILLEAGKLNIENEDTFCSYITAKLSEYTTVNRNGAYYKLFKPEEINENKSRVVDQKSTEISSGQTVEEQFREFKEPVKRKVDEYTKCLAIIARAGNTLERMAFAMVDKYSEGYEAEIKTFFKPIEKKTEFYIEYLTKLQNARNHIDDRNKWGEYEKLMAKFLMDVGETIADLAKEMNYSSKYGSIGVKRNPYADELYQFLRSCPKCKTDIEYEINEDIERYKIGKDLKLEPPVKGY